MPPPDRPNVLVLLTDDHGQWAAGCYGTPQLRTPSMDWLAATGARMADAFTPCPVCSPARACFHTGRFPSQHGIHDYLYTVDERINGRNWLADEITLYELLSRTGYRVGHFGKWHCGLDREPKPGTDRWFSFWVNQGGHRGPVDYSDQGRKVSLDGYNDRIVADQAMQWLREGPGGRPWFAFVGLTATHSAHVDMPERLVASYRGVAEAVIGTTPPPDDVYKSWPIEDWPELQAQYFAAVTQIDGQLGRLIDLLDERGELDRTLIVYTSDHGCHAGQLGYWEKGNITRPLNMYERSIRVPMLLRLPGRIAPGQVRTEFVDHCDLFHTVLDCAGVELDATLRAERRLVGQSFAPLLRPRSPAAAGSSPPDWRDVQFGEYGPVRMARSRTHKLLRRHGHGADQLFDLVADPDERQNVIAEPVHAAVVADLDGRLSAFFAGHEDPAHSGLRVRGQIGRFNDDEPWDPRFDDWRYHPARNPWRDRKL